MKTARGQYRSRGLAGRPDSAFVTDKTISFDVDEALYRRRGYEPPFDELPWKERSDR